MAAIEGQPSHRFVGGDWDKPVSAPYYDLPRCVGQQQYHCFGSDIALHDARRCLAHGARLCRFLRCSRCRPELLGSKVLRTLQHPTAAVPTITDTSTTRPFLRRLILKNRRYSRYRSWFKEIGGACPPLLTDAQQFAAIGCGDSGFKHHATILELLAVWDNSSDGRNERSCGFCLH